MRSLSTNWKIVFSSIAALVAIPVVFYLTKFGSFQFSEDFDTWVDFSTFLSPYLFTALTIILAYISWQSLELMKLKEKPVLVIEEYPEYADNSNLSIPNFHYRIKNLGQGSAMNMRLFIKIRDQLLELDTFLLRKYISKGSNGEKIDTKEGFHYMVHSFSILPGQEIRINWQFHVEKLALVYDDIYLNTKTIILDKGKQTNFEFDEIKIDKFGFKGTMRVFSNGKAVNGIIEPKRIFTIDEVVSKKWDYNRI